MSKKQTKRRGKAQQKKSPLDKFMPFIIGAVVIVGVIVLILALQGPAVGYTLQDMGRDHMSMTGGGCQTNYNSRPPTSGCHHPNILGYEIFDTPQPDRNLVHNLEHGGIIISYRQSNIPGEDDILAADITDFVRDLQQQDSKYCRLIVAPYDAPFAAPRVPELKDKASQMKIALTAWTKIDMMEEFDEERALAFIDAHINRGPENVNDCQ